MTDAEKINDIYEFVKNRIVHYEILRIHECYSRFDEEMFEAVEDALEEVKHYIELIAKVSGA